MANFDPSKFGATLVTPAGLPPNKTSSSTSNLPSSSTVSTGATSSFDPSKFGAIKVMKQESQKPATEPTKEEAPKGSPMILGSLYRAAQPVGLGISTLLESIGGYSKKGGVADALEMSKTADRLTKQAQKTQNPEERAQLLRQATKFSQGASESLSALNAAYGAEEKDVSQDIKTPFGTVELPKVGQPIKETLMKETGTALKTVSAGIPSLAGYGAIHGAGEALEKGADITTGAGALQVVGTSAKEAILSKLFGLASDKLLSPIARYGFNKLPDVAKQEVTKLGAEFSQTIQKVGQELDKGPSANIGAEYMQKGASAFANFADYLTSPKRITQSLIRGGEKAYQVMSDIYNPTTDEQKIQKITEAYRKGFPGGTGRNSIEYRYDYDPHESIAREVGEIPLKNGRADTIKVVDNVVVPKKKLAGEVLGGIVKNNPVAVNLTEAKDAAINAIRSKPGGAIGTNSEIAIKRIEEEYQKQITDLARQGLVRQTPSGFITDAATAQQVKISTGEAGYANEFATPDIQTQAGAMRKYNSSISNQIADSLDSVGMKDSYLKINEEYTRLSDLQSFLVSINNKKAAAGLWFSKNVARLLGYAAGMPAGPVGEATAIVTVDNVMDALNNPNRYNNLSKLLEKDPSTVTKAILDIYAKQIESNFNLAALKQLPLPGTTSAVTELPSAGVLKGQEWLRNVPPVGTNPNAPNIEPMVFPKNPKNIEGIIRKK